MDNNDVLVIQEAVRTVTDPLQKTVAALALKVDYLPCGEHDTRVNTIETQHTLEKEHKHDKRDSKNLMFKLILVIVGIGGLLQTIGFFRSIGE